MLSRWRFAVETIRLVDELPFFRVEEILDALRKAIEMVCRASVGSVIGVGVLWRLFLVGRLLGLRGRLGLGRRVGRRVARVGGET
jgi:hypothetical protein